MKQEDQIMNSKIDKQPKLLEKIVISKYDDGTTTREICAEGVQICIVKNPDNDIKFVANIPHDANKRDLVKRLTSLTQQEIGVVIGVAQPTISDYINNT